MFLYSVGRKPGRPKVIPEATVPKVIALYKQGLGYRAIARELKKENLSVNWSTVRRLIKKELRCKPLRRCDCCFNVVSTHSINKDRHAIAYCSKRVESNKYPIRPMGQHVIEICRWNVLTQGSQHLKNGTDKVHHMPGHNAIIFCRTIKISN